MKGQEGSKGQTVACTSLLTQFLATARSYGIWKKENEQDMEEEGNWKRREEKEHEKEVYKRYNVDKQIDLSSYLRIFYK